MSEQPPGRRIIWESKAKQVVLAATCFLFAAAAIWTEPAYASFSFWGGILLFGGGGSIMLYRLLNPNNVFVNPTSARGKQLIAEQFAAEQADLGSVSYTNSGFETIQLSGSRHYAWADLETAFGYKIDRFATDEICLDLFFKDGGYFNLSEETTGWYLFLAKLHENVPAIASAWHVTISSPAFETCLTLLFDSAGRTQAQAEALRYH